MQGTYLFRPWTPGYHPVDAVTRAPHYLTTWLAEFPDSKATDDHKLADFEDWAENAVLLHEARLQGLPVTVLPAGEKVKVITSGWLRPKSTQDAPCGAVLGYWAQSDMLFGLPVPLRLSGQTARAVDAASNYVMSPVFQKYSGRRVINAAAVAEELEVALATIVGDRPSADVFVKTIRKQLSGIIRLEGGRPLWEQFYEDERWEATAWSIERFRGNRQFLLVQDVVSCRYEYRFFVVGGKLVSGAGCIEMFTPLNNTEIFDPQMEPVRSRSEVGMFPDIRDQHLELARRYVAEFAAEHGEDLDYCLDVCLNDAGESIVIEMNPPMNCGRYASDVGSWMRAVVDRTESLIRADED